ncbi:MAG: 50S ribosomal protein L11 methyltransferase [Ruminococcaceae bacterium]|nr:50S ribosomal protein L11 methyltransferase [Oscillospiraceae bacterium]
MMNNNVDKDYVCGDFGDVVEWQQIKVTVPTVELDALVEIMSEFDTNLLIEDLSDIDLKTCYGDLIDEKILNADKSHASVSWFVPLDSETAKKAAMLRAAVEKGGFSEYEVELIGHNEEDWANSWKEFYKPFKIGRIVIVPAWEKYEAQDGEIIVSMDPGMAFGTGTHETTRLIIGLLQKYVKEGMSLLDVGTGSGILAICGAKLGANPCRAYDIDPMSVRVANENIAESGLSGVISCEQSDLLTQVKNIAGGYDIICANIVADIIIRMTPDVAPFMSQKTVLLVSGIIAERCDDVVNCFEQNGFKIVEKSIDNGWCALAVSLG